MKIFNWSSCKNVLPAMFLAGLVLISNGLVHAIELKGMDNDKLKITGEFKVNFGATEHIDFVEHGKSSDADIDATRELSFKTEFIPNENIKGVASFQVGEGSTGGYFGSPDAGLGGEESGDLIWELDSLYLEFKIPDTELTIRAGSQPVALPDGVYGSHILSETPAGVLVNSKITDYASVDAGWVRISDLMEDGAKEQEDQADLFFAYSSMKFNQIKLTPYAAFARIGEDVIRESQNEFGNYAFFDYPALVQEAFSSIGNVSDATMVIDDVTAYYLGFRIDINPTDKFSAAASALYGDMDWETETEDISIAGFFIDFTADYKLGFMTPEIFGFYGSGPDEDDTDLNVLPTLIGGPSYTSSYFGGSRFNDNMFDSHDASYAVSMWGAGFKLKDIYLGPVKNEFQFMYANGTAEDKLFEAPDDILLNEDESFFEVNFNSEYEIMSGLTAATELGYIAFEEDDDYDKASGDAADLWKVALALELSF